MALTPLEKKVINHSVKTLKSIDMYNIYQAVDKKMKGLLLEENIRTQILTTLNVATAEERAKINDSVEFLENL